MKHPWMDELNKLSSQIILNRFRSADKKAFLFAYSRNGEGTTTVLSQLCLQIAKDSRLSVLLVDANLRSPRLHALWDIQPAPGLTELCSSPSRIDSHIRKTDLPNLFLLPAGAFAQNPIELFTSEGFKKVLAKLKNDFDLLFFDSAPLAFYGDALALGYELDGAFLLIRAQFTSKREIQQSRQQLIDRGIEIVCGILNRKKTSVPRFLRELFQVSDVD